MNPNLSELDIFNEVTSLVELNIGGNTKMAYEEVNPEFWTYTKDGDFIEGVLVNSKNGVGENSSMLYVIETSEGFKNVWGSTILDSRMSVVKLGSKLKITYKGLGEKSKGKNPPKIFKVEIDKQ